MVIDDKYILLFEESLNQTLECLRLMEKHKIVACKGQVNYWNEKLGIINRMIKYFENQTDE